MVLVLFLVEEYRMKMESEGPAFSIRGVNIVTDELPYADWDLRQKTQRKITREHKTDQLY